jgi:hypothetical protein
MKYLLFIFIIFATNIYAQVRETEIKVYVPIRTYHFDRHPSMGYHSTEGGHGVVGVYRRTDGNWYNDIQAGVLTNSYNSLSFLVQYGIGKHIGNLDVSVNIGIITGYNKLFKPYIRTDGSYDDDGIRNILTTNLPDIMSKNGILPVISIALSYNIGRVSPLLVINPQYLNAGIIINL